MAFQEQDFCKLLRNKRTKITMEAIGEWAEDLVAMGLALMWDLDTKVWTLLKVPPNLECKAVAYLLRHKATLRLFDRLRT